MGACMRFDVTYPWILLLVYRYTDEQGYNYEGLLLMSRVQYPWILFLAYFYTDEQRYIWDCS